ncbi:Transposase [Cordylochernes scorpioides]|uniref:Transposase n=1 Tax=Cordylochernes scorpioides TaxID=51811 RepID=A0ABY6K3X6_9ARAC|nr:Transposase [Cordylochernes scorpioides]
MEEQTNPSNDTADQTIPKQETTFEEEETAPPQDNSADPLTQIADALSKLLVARSPREIDVSPYDGTFEAQSFFDNFDAQADRAELTYTDRLRKLPCYLQEDYYQNKTVMGMKLYLPADILIESLTDGLPVADQRLIATVQPNTIKEWFDLVSRITQCATSAGNQRQVDKAPHPTYHNPPPRYNNQRPSRVTYQVTPPPSPCKYCNAMHWHSQCEQRFPRDRTRPVYSARPRTTTVPKRGTHTQPKVQSPSHVPQVQAASQDDSASPASSSTNFHPIGYTVDKGQANQRFGFTKWKLSLPFRESPKSPQNGTSKRCLPLVGGQLGLTRSVPAHHLHVVQAMIIMGTMTAQRYVDDVLRPVTLPYLQGVPNALYQQDNARPHTARISQQALQDVQMLPWPPYSPDLSPIEHVWDIIGRRLHALPQPRSEDDLWQMVEREWRAIPQDDIRTLIDSLPRRVAACIAVRGGPTCY